MNVFDVLREKLEESQERYDDVAFAEMNENGHTLDFEYANGKKDGVSESIEIVNQVEQEYNNGWIPCSERLPKVTGYYLIQHTRKICADEMAVAFYSVEEAMSDRDYTWEFETLSDVKEVIAWQPLPEPYREDGIPKKRTNADRIRSMSDEELTKIIMCPYDTAGDPIDIMPCVTELGTQELVSPEFCNKCMMKWLQREVDK